MLASFKGKSVEAEQLIRGAVARQLSGRSLSAAVAEVADILGLTQDRILRAWVEATEPEQENTLAFLSRDHGSYRLASPLPDHPDIRAHRLNTGPGDLLATFEDRHVWLIFRDGAHAFVKRQ